MKRLLALALAALLYAVPATVLGLGLGEIKLHSALNQTLDAEIELLNPTPDELDGLVVRLAAPELFDRYGIERPALLADLRFDVVRRSDGSAFVRIASTQSVREPFLTLLIEARWARGRLLREYTMLVDPPTFMPAEPAPEPAPVVSPEPAAYADPVTSAEPTATQTPVPSYTPPPESQPEYSAPATTSPQFVPAETQPTQQPATDAYQAPLGGDYGPVKRAETLWAIAQRLKPSDAITMNQMMLAIFRANPEAFVGNINRLRAGAILRIPDLDAVRELSPREAFLEAKRQHEAWRPSLAAPSAAEPDYQPTPRPEPVAPVAPVPRQVEPAPQPSLSVVAPSDEAEPAVELDPAARVAQLERELATARTQGSNTKAKRDRIARLERDLAAAQRLIQVPSDTLSAVQQQAAQPSLGEPQVTPVPEPTDAPPAATDAPEPTPAATPRAPRKKEKGLVDTVLDNLTNPLVLGGLVLVVLIVAGLLGFKRIRPKLKAIAEARRARAEAAAAAKAAAAAEWTESDDDRTVIASDDATDAGGAGEAKTALGGLFGGGQDGRTGETMVGTDQTAAEAAAEAAAEKTQFAAPPGDFSATVAAPAAAPAAAAAAAPAQAGHEETVIGGTPIKLDDNDPLSEADFHMAYGLYDQAAELLAKAAQRDPSRRDIKLKLLETYFASGNKDAFIASARALRAEMGAKPDADWNSVLIFGKQMAPDEPLFSEQASAGAADLDFGADAGGTETAIDLAFDAPAEAPAQPAADSLADFDITGAAAPAPAEAPAADEFDLGDFQLDAAPATPAAAPERPAPAIGGGEAGPKDTDTQSDFDKALQELSAFVDTNLPAGEQGGEDNGGEFNLDSLDLGDDDAALGDVDLGGGDGAGDEIDTKLDLARAYIDMGDPDGARNILDEVVGDGNPTQQAEAQKLLAQIK